MMTFSVTVLGLGAAIPLTHRNPSAQLVNIHNHLILLDCAEGTQVQMRRSRIPIQKLSHIFISHLHGDHYYGLMGLITSLHLLGREHDLHIYADGKLEKIIALHLEASQTKLRYRLHFHTIDTGKHSLILDEASFTVSTIPMKHNFPDCGFLIREKQGRRNIRKDFLEGKELRHEEYVSIKDGKDYVAPDGKVYANDEITYPPPAPRSYAYCTDTAYNESMIPLIEGADLLYHEATFMEDRKADAEAKFHSTAAEAAMIAKKAGAGRLMLGHFSARYRELDPILNEARAIFPETILVEEGGRVEV
jgi:ribonuclease Z